MGDMRCAVRGVEEEVSTRARMLVLRQIALASAFVLTGCARGPALDEHSKTDLAVTRAPIRGVVTNSGSFRGQYTVPVPLSLASAAIFSVSEVDWQVVGNIVNMHYYLPPGLVGGSIEIEMSGAIGGDLSTVSLTGENGTAACHAVDWTITCSETLANLGPLPISMDVVRSVAAREYAGSPEDRVAVAQIFPSDPIGTLVFDVRFPAIPNSGG